MNPSGDFGRTVSDWLHADAEHRVPPHLEAVLRRTRTERQRPAWSSLERWLPLDTTLRLTPVPRAGWLLIVLALVLALGTAIVIVGTSQRRLPDPFGPAANGALVYGAEGDIYAFDPATGTSRAIIAGPTADVGAFFSRDGSMLLFTRRTETPGLWQLMVASADGTNIRPLGDPAEPLLYRAIMLDPNWGVSGSLDGWVSWSPDGTRTAGIDTSGQGTLVIGNIDGSPSQVLDLDLSPESISWRPNGQELVFRGLTFAPDGEIATVGLYIVGADGNGLRPILHPTYSAEHWQAPALSPDGTKIIYTQWGGDAYPGGHLYVVDIDSGVVRLLEFDGAIESDYYAAWSPDGRQVVFNRGRAQDKHYLAVGPAGGGHAVDIGPVMPWGDGATAAAVFSPDGSKVIARYSDGSTWMFDAAGGPGERLRINPPSPMSWQRLAP
jgi:Tol biopolymer transport system component